MVGQEIILLPKASLPKDLRYTNVGRLTREHFFTPMELLMTVVGKPLAIMQANIRHRSQTTPYLKAFIDSKATGLILALSESVQRDFGVCIEEVIFFAAKIIDEYNSSGLNSNGAEKRVAFLFDHALTYEAAEKALEAGVSGIMYDPSDGGRKAMSIEKNIQLSKRFVELAEKYKASVELEVGVIPGMERAVETEFTDPSAVVTLVKAYPNAAVAISVGNEHYRLSPKGRGLQLRLFKTIREAAPRTPLVLHGGTGVSDVDLKASITGLMLNKLNVGTEFIKETLLIVARIHGWPEPTERQLRDPAFCRDLLFYLDAYPEKFLEETRKVVHREALAKLAFLTGDLSQ